MSGRDKALDRARKLQAIALDQKGTPEGATAASLVSALVERWGFTDEEVNPPREEAVVVHRAVIVFRKPEVHARGMLLAVLAEIADCYSTYRVAEDGWRGKVYGENPKKIAMVLLMFDVVENKIQEAIRRSPSYSKAQEGYNNLRKRNAGKAEFLATIAKAQETFERQVLINWTRTVAACLREVWNKRNPEESGDEVSEASSAPSEATVKGKGKVLETAAPPTPSTALAETKSSGNGFEEKIRAAAAAAPKETWAIDEDAWAFAEGLTADLSFEDPDAGP